MEDDTVMQHSRKDAKIEDNLKQAVEIFLVDSTIKMYIYALQEFSPGISKEKDLEIVHKVTLFEKIIINLFRTQNKKIANKKLTLPEKGAECPYPQILTEIITDFKMNMTIQ
jgi:hypothetical protein